MFQGVKLPLLSSSLLLRHVTYTLEKDGLFLTVWIPLKPLNILNVIVILDLPPLLRSTTVFKPQSAMSKIPAFSTISYPQPLYAIDHAQLTSQLCLCHVNIFL